MSQPNDPKAIQKSEAQYDKEVADTFPASDPPGTTSPVVGTGKPPRPAGSKAPIFGLMLSSEEHGPLRLVDYAGMAEQAGMNFVAISDHFHPWTPEQGNSPFVWSVIGGIATTTTRLRVGTTVTCPTMRMHPAIVAHAAATASEMLQGRFFLGVGTGEALNEHVTGGQWPTPRVRLAMLAEAIEVMRELWTGEQVHFSGEFYDVNDATLYTKPSAPLPIYVAAASPAAARMAAENDGLITTSPLEHVFNEFNSNGGQSKPRYGQITVCWDEDKAEAEERLYKTWPISPLDWDAKSDIPSPHIFGNIAKLIPKEEVIKSTPCGPDPAPIIEKVKQYHEAGFDHIYFHQIGQNIGPFLKFFEREIEPALADTPAARRLAS